MEIQLRTLTPLWTGGVDRTCDRVHETGIIGSLRWWYEALVRGLGGWACDPTEHECKDDERCAACELFGATGWGRQFRLRVIGEQRASPAFGEIKVTTQQQRGWRLEAGMLSDELTLLVLPMRPTDQQALNALAFLFSFVARWAALGARTQVGYGVIRVESISVGEKPLSLSEIADTLALIERAAQRHPASGQADKRLPDIRGFFFACLRLPPDIKEGILKWLGDTQYAAARSKGFVPTAPAVRYEMRSWLRDPNFVPGIYGLDDLRHDLMGTIRVSVALDAPRGSKIFASHLYRTKDGWEFRVWGWVPDLSTYDVQRDALIQAIQQRLESQGFARAIFGLNRPLQVEWHSFDRSGLQSVADYLRSLVHQTERRAR